MPLNWESRGGDSWSAKDEDTGLIATIEKSSPDPLKPYNWFIALPGAVEDRDDCHGHAASLEEAKADAEDAMPDQETLDEWEAEDS